MLRLKVIKDKRGFNALFCTFILLLSFESFASRYSITLNKDLETTKSVRQLRSKLYLSQDLSVQALLGSHQSKLSLPKGQIEDVLVSSNVIIGNFDETLGSPQISEKMGVIERETFRPLPKIGRQSLLATTFDKNNLVPFNLVARPWGLELINAGVASEMVSPAQAKVLILDSGIDAKHPQFENRVVEVRDFTQEGDGSGKDEEGHGTHVAGTVAGQTVGVFPQALIFAGKVCGLEGCSNIAIAQGLEWAAQQKLDVVNLSLGGAQLSSVERRALETAEAAGVTVVAAAGNDGKRKVSFPGAFSTAFAVGAVDSNVKKAKFSNWGPELDISAPGVDVFSSVPLQSAVIPKVVINTENKYLEVKGSLFPESPKLSSSIRFPLQYVGLGKAEDLNGKSLKGRAALIKRGELSFAEKFKNALIAGASAVVFFNNEPGLINGQISPTGDELTIPVLMIEQKIGEQVVESLNKGQTSQIELSVTLSDFDSYSGTSMASPHVAGVAALVKAANPKLKPQEVRRILSETVKPVESNVDNELGAGLVDAEKAEAKAIELR